MGCSSSSLCAQGSGSSQTGSGGPHGDMGGKSSVPAKHNQGDVPPNEGRITLQQLQRQQEQRPMQQLAGQAQTQQHQQHALQGIANPAITSVAAMDTPRSVDSDLAMVDKLLVQNTKSEIQKNRLELNRSPHPAASASQPGPAATGPESPRAPPSPEQHAPVKQQMSTVGETARPRPVDPNDPWAALQSAYRIDAGRGSPTKHTGKDRMSSGARATSTANQSGILVLDEDEDVGGRYSTNVKQAGKKLAAKPVQGGWGKGAMAQAGTLMVGEDEVLGHLAPPNTLPPAVVQSPKVDPEEEYAQLRSRIKASAVQTDLGIEDLEDIDDLLKAEDERAGLKPSLASKLAAFEALAGDV